MDKVIAQLKSSDQFVCIARSVKKPLFLRKKYPFGKYFKKK
jgi:hypothetical protein